MRLWPAWTRDLWPTPDPSIHSHRATTPTATAPQSRIRAAQAAAAPLYDATPLPINPVTAAGPEWWRVDPGACCSYRPSGKWLPLVEAAAARHIDAALSAPEQAFRAFCAQHPLLGAGAGGSAGSGSSSSVGGGGGAEPFVWGPMVGLHVSARGAQARRPAPLPPL